MNASACILSPSNTWGGIPAGFRSALCGIGIRWAGGIPSAVWGSPGLPGPPGPPGPQGVHPRAMSKVSLMFWGLPELWGGGRSLSPPPVVIVCMIVLVVTMVCVDIRSWLCMLLTGWSPRGVPYLILLVWCGLPGLLGLIIAGVLLIYRLMRLPELSSLTSVSGYTLTYSWRW